ncbi:MAG: hypothetical protein HYX90_00730 [Chloroflexi bacterium]|nr:hypothetical protein [Chloroflexota bacterium]
MRTAFDFKRPVPELKDPFVFAALNPWIDVGKVGTLTLARLAADLHAVPLADLSRPEFYYDFTRYRPFFRLVEGRRVIEVSNTTVSCAVSGVTTTLFSSVFSNPTCWARPLSTQFSNCCRPWG